MSPCPPLKITTVCPWLINPLSDPWDFNKSNGILLRSHWHKPYPKFYGSEFYGSGCVYLGVVKKTSQKVPTYLPTLLPTYLPTWWGGVYQSGVGIIPLTSTKSQFPPPLWFPYSATWPSAVPAALPADLRGAAVAAGAAMSRPGPRPASLPIFGGSGTCGKTWSKPGENHGFSLGFLTDVDGFLNGNWWIFPRFQLMLMDLNDFNELLKDFKWNNCQQPPKSLLHCFYEKKWHPPSRTLQAPPYTSIYYMEVSFWGYPV